MYIYIYIYNIVQIFFYGRKLIKIIQNTFTKGTCHLQVKKKVKAILIIITQFIQYYLEQIFFQGSIVHTVIILLAKKNIYKYL